MIEPSKSADIAVIGAGIAGASVAAELSATQRVVLIEREGQPGYHTTGRSAALFTETYGPPAIRALSRASAPFFDAPPGGFSDHPLLTPRGVLMIARKDQLASLDRLIAEVAPLGDVRRLSAEETRAMAPLLRADYVAAAMHEPGARDIDVHALHHGYLRWFRAHGGDLLTDADVRALTRDGAGWRIETSRGEVRADVVVNASGAWADQIAGLAGAAPVGLVPKRRTALTVAAPEGSDPNPWPMVVDVDEDFYLKPDAGRLLISPADETPSPPCDAQPDEYDVALCVDRVETAFDLSVRRIESRWAGLRSFVADKTPVVGFDPHVPGFFWLAGQGGYGIQSAPALARLAASVLQGRPIPADIADQGVTEADLRPERLDLAA
ncbi:NAD(P)/FAD-dependent oxidoreductase [Amorphus orientalis]|uniref:D-arginine dehydrogenase n=1 Tax=Amorphus orientalis TaxID=649198 RepID=A0AAE4AQW9_9HYPH|nr:FAD-binding oxidoreductase [Amorphus orientalis]MDQ0313603.1 D-arginine dehydrogenase [Amorphus orientalis]